MALVIGYEMVPRNKYPTIAAQVAGATSLGALIGPLIGGGISEYSPGDGCF
jgi:MFS family permease